MFSTTTDILIIIAALAIAVLTFFVSWMIYYFIRILRQANKMVDEIKEKVEKFGELLDLFKQKLNDSLSNLGLLTKSIVRLIDYFKERKSNRGKTRRKDDSDF
jgi:predicted PurR-regulated permease PerM